MKKKMLKSIRMFVFGFGMCVGVYFTTPINYNVIHVIFWGYLCALAVFGWLDLFVRGKSEMGGRRMNEFNWTKFHKDLDMATASLINESVYPTIFLPSKISLMDFMSIANKKRQEEDTSLAKGGKDGKEQKTIR